MFVYECSGSYDARDSPRILRLTFGFGWRIIEEFVAYRNVLVQVLHQDF